MLLQETYVNSHLTHLNQSNLFFFQAYEKYKKKMEYKYMTTVSLPVYGRRPNEVFKYNDKPVKYFNVGFPLTLLRYVLL